MNEQQKQEQADDPTPPVVRLAAAEVDVAAAKDRLNDTVARLQSKMDPKLLAKEASDEAKRVGERGVAVARANQSIIGGIAGGHFASRCRPNRGRSGCSAAANTRSRRKPPSR